MGGNEAYLDRARQLTIEQKAALCLGSDIWHTAPVPEHGIGPMCSPTARTACAGSPTGGDHAGIGGSLPGHLLPDRVRARLVVGPRAGPRGRRGARRGGAGAGRRGRARAGHQHQALAAVRPQLRVPLRGPVPRRRAGRGARRGHAEPGRRHLAQALRRQQPGDRPAAGQRRGRRAHPARDLPARVRARGHRGAAVDGDVRLQQGQRHLRLRAPLAAHRGAARRVGLRRAGGVRLGRGARPGGRAGRRARPGDAAATSGSATRAIVDAVARRRRCDEAVLDAAVARVLQLVDRRAACPSRPPTVDVDAHHALARARPRPSARCCCKNDGGVLPLRRPPGQRSR